MFDFSEFIDRHHDWARQVFGKTAPERIINHIRKECLELEEAPNDLEEWIDVILLALDGARQIAPAEAVIAMLEAKLAKNKTRKWPDQNMLAPGAPLEHIR